MCSRASKMPRELSLEADDTCFHYRRPSASWAHGTEDELNEEFQEQYVRLRIKDGGQWEDSTGDMGTWEVDGNLLTFCRDNNDELNTRYFLSTNELVLNFGLLEFLELDEDFDDEDREVFTATFEEDASFQIIFRRVE